MQSQQPGKPGQNQQDSQSPDAEQPEPLNSAAQDGETTINTGGGAYIEGRVETGGGNFAGRDMITTQITIQSKSEKADLPISALRQYQHNPLLKILYHEEECAQASQIGLHYLVAKVGRNQKVLEQELAELVEVGLVKHFTRSADEGHIFQYYSITGKGISLVLSD